MDIAMLTTIFENSNATFHGMLLSTNKSDVTEALKFFVKATHFWSTRTNCLYICISTLSRSVFLDHFQNMFIRVEALET